MPPAELITSSISFHVPGLPYILTLLIVALVGLFVFSVFATIVYLDYRATRRLLKHPVVMIELIPPADVYKTPLATAELFSVVHGLIDTLSATEKLLRHKQVMSLEIVSTRNEGIRFIAGVPKQNVTSFIQAMQAYMPDITFGQSEDYVQLLERGRKVNVMDLKQTNCYAYPFATQNHLDQHDPVAFLTGSMIQLRDGEVMALQLVVSAAPRHVAAVIRSNVLDGDDIKLSHDPWFSPLPIIGDVLMVFIDIIWGVVQAFGDQPLPDHTRVTDTKDQRSHKTEDDPNRQQLIDSVYSKLSEPLFRCDFRAIVAMQDDQRNRQRVHALIASLKTFQRPGIQGLHLQSNFPNFVWTRYRLFSFSNRLPALFADNSNILSTSEIAAIFHFPFGHPAESEEVNATLTHTLAPPLAVKQHADKHEFDVIFGVNQHHGQETAIGLMSDERQRHIYVVGGTGGGKTTLLKYAILQDIQNGKGLAVIDPHGDLAESLLGLIPPNRLAEVVYFNPDDLSYPIGLNLLELQGNENANELLREKDLITESVVSIFRKLFSEDGDGGHRIEYILRNTVQTALTLDDPTLFTVYKLLNNPRFRKDTVAKLKNEDLQQFWWDEFNKAGNYQQTKMTAGVTSKIGRFLFSASAKRILEQPRSTLDFEDIMNSGKILICNFSKGLLGEDTAQLFGTLTLAKLQLAALRRARQPEHSRRPYYLYVDEFQNFATTSFVQMLSESRKYQLLLVMAEQSTSQQKDQRTVNVILANVGTIICFRTGNPSDEKLLIPIFSPFVHAGEIANLSAFNFYARLSALQAQAPLSGRTILVKEKSNPIIAANVVSLSRYKYAPKYIRRAEKLPGTITLKEIVTF